jgi:hypothetical protein
MPYRPHKRVIKRKDDRVPLTNPQLEHLIFGWTWIDDEFPFSSEEHRKECWHRHRKEIMAMMTDDENASGLKPYLLMGMRPAAWFEYEEVPARERDQSTPDYLDKHGMWLSDEKRKYLQMEERKEKILKSLRTSSDLPDQLTH